MNPSVQEDNTRSQAKEHSHSRNEITTKTNISGAQDDGNYTGDSQSSHSAGRYYQTHAMPGGETMTKLRQPSHRTENVHL